MHVAIIDEELPCPLNSGKRIRTYQLVSRLARRHRITYVCHRNADRLELEQAVSAFSDLGIETVVVDRPVPPRSGLAFYGRLAANVLSPLPYSVASHRSVSLDRAIRDLAARDRVDLWQAEWTPYAASLQDLKNTRRLIMAHNVESKIWRRYWEQEPQGAKRWYIGRQWRKYERFEGRVCRQADQVVAVSDEDAALIRDQFGLAHVAVVENGVDTAFFRPDRSLREQGLLLFLGSLDWRPNLDAVDQLLSTIFPAVRAQEPRARLCLVGRHPPEALRRRVASAPGVELHASVPDVRPFLARSMLLVVPLRIGGGSRLKILEAFAAGLPVISTRIGAEGLKVQSGVHLAVVENVAGMADPIVSLLKDPERRSSLAGEGRSLVEAHYKWQRLADQLERIWTSLELAQEPTQFALA
ncbi:MAG TPA: glycosyltransferase family 4 protein [Isosphaeraceae bacterium]|nr:glycosyltransferase family 4 protein [Isosphaeraceae bacterium]